MSDNELIAEFDGLEIDKFADGSYRYTFTDPITCESYGYAPDELQYHISWDWLMPVVEKINESPKPKRVRWDTISRETDKVLDLPIYTPIQDVHKAVVEFIKWYNQNKP